MNPGSESPDPSGPPASISEVEGLLAAVATQENVADAFPTSAPAIPAVQPYDFRNPSLLSTRELRKLRSHQEGFIGSLASRLSSHLRLEFSLKLASLQTSTYQKLAASWANPSHLTLFKIEPLRGVAVLEIQPLLGLAMVDRLLGGSGQAQEAGVEMSEIEKALLEQTVQLILEEWCGQWNRVKELKPVILGCESNGAFVQAATAETIMLVLALEAGFGEITGQIQIALPFAALESMVRQLSQGSEAPAKPAPTPVAAACRWNSSFDDVCVPVTAEWHGLEMSAREVLALKVGDVVKLSPECAQQIDIRLADLPKFQGRPGTVAGQWAVELTQLIKR
jgi:flagellar motor switch protein FliM